MENNTLEKDFIKDCKLVLQLSQKINFNEVIKKELINIIHEIIINKKDSNLKDSNLTVSDYYIINPLLEKINNLFETIEDDLLIPDNKEVYKGMVLNSIQNSASQAVYKTLSKFINPHKDLIEQIINSIE